jgi:hypothetical protein
MAEEKERGPEIIEAHQDLVGHVERGASKMRALSIVTVVVALSLSLSYLAELVLPFFGPSVQSVNLADPGLRALELVVLALALVWLYVGVRDLRFSSRMKREIHEARLKEKEVGA